MINLEDRLRGALHRRAEAATISHRSDQQPLKTRQRSRRGVQPTDTWRTLAASPLDGRIAPAVWTGTDMLVVAGRNSDRDGMFAFGDGAAYDPATDRWHKVADGPAHPGFQATWTGEAMILFAKGRLFRYDPATDAWTDPDVNQFSGQGRLLWTGRELILSGTTFNGTDVSAGLAAIAP